MWCPHYLVGRGGGTASTVEEPVNMQAGELVHEVCGPGRSESGQPCLNKIVVSLTFFVNSLSVSGLEGVGGQSRLGAMHTARLNAVIWLSSDCFSILYNTPKR